MLFDLNDHRPPEHDQAVPKAMAWLGERHRKGWSNAFTATVAEFSSDGAPGLAEVDEDDGPAILINVGTWLLGPRNPAFAAAAARWPRRWRRSPTRSAQVPHNAYASREDEPAPVLDIVR